MLKFFLIVGTLTIKVFTILLIEFNFLCNIIIGIAAAAAGTVVFFLRRLLLSYDDVMEIDTVVANKNI